MFVDQVKINIKAGNGETESLPFGVKSTFLMVDLPVAMGSRRRRNLKG
ncbi:hypothetical protein S100313_01309 [Pediococcus acidilactici]|nr:hypothetical protein S100313_01309 [Pediococcus acidilactici]